MKRCNLCGLRDDSVELSQANCTWCPVFEKEVENKEAGCEHWRPESGLSKIERIQIANSIKQVSEKSKMHEELIKQRVLDRTSSEKMTKRALIISIISVLIALGSFVIAFLVWHDNRRLSGLELSPEIRLYSRLYKKPPEFTIYNIGPVEALQLEVDQLWHMYIKGKIGIASSLGNNRYKLSEFKPHDKITLAFDKITLYNAGLGFEVPKQNNIVEVRIIYRRSSDKKKFQQSAFFLYNPAGQLVREDDVSLIPAAEFYKRLINAATQSFKETQMMANCDTLHSLELNK